MLGSTEKFAIIDIETTGGSYRYDKITEIAIIVYQNGEIIDKFETLVNPCRTIPLEIIRITGITNEMVEDAPKFFEIAKTIVEKTENCIFVAHNVFFDYSFIKEEFQQLGFTYTRKKLCTVQLSRKYFRGLRSYSLGSLIRHFDIEVNQRHRAMEDTQATLKVFQRILKAYELTYVGSSSVHYLLKESKIPAHLNADKIRNIPEACGVYYMKDENGFCVYIGKSINIHARIMQHFNEVSLKSKKMLLQVFHIDYELTGNELMALLIESRDIKVFQPEINRAQRLRKYSHAIIRQTNTEGFYQYHLKSQQWLTDQDEIVTYFSSAFAGKEFIKYIMDQYSLCQAVNSAIESVFKPCHSFQLGGCLGACANRETLSEYNHRFSLMHSKENKIFEENFAIFDFGRNPLENSAILIEEGFCSYFGYLDKNQSYPTVDDLKDALEPYNGTIETNRIITNYIGKNNRLKILRWTENMHREIFMD